MSGCLSRARAIISIAIVRMRSFSHLVLTTQREMGTIIPLFSHEETKALGQGRKRMSWDLKQTWPLELQLHS